MPLPPLRLPTTKQLVDAEFRRRVRLASYVLSALQLVWTIPVAAVFVNNAQATFTVSAFIGLYFGGPIALACVLFALDATTVVAVHHAAPDVESGGFLRSLGVAALIMMDSAALLSMANLIGMWQDPQIPQAFPYDYSADSATDAPTTTAESHAGVPAPAPASLAGSYLYVGNSQADALFILMSVFASLAVVARVWAIERGTIPSQWSIAAQEDGAARGVVASASAGA